MRCQASERKTNVGKESCGNDGVVESEESQKQASLSFHEPLGNPANTAGFPHSHSSGDEGGWKSGKPRSGFPLSHGPESPFSTLKHQAADGLRRPPRAALRAT